MSDFEIYLPLGFQHITDLKGYDHILFVIALCAIYRLKDWSKVIILVTAFTIGHSITLGLATLNLINYSTKLIELLIPITIVLTCILNFFHKSAEYSLDVEKPSFFRYPVALAFGLIHGMGFSNYLRSLLGKEESIWQPLLAFNVGLEIGQLLIVVIILTINSLLLDILRVKKHNWNLILSGIILGIALTLIRDAEFWN
ncbi:MAG: HupE/UreJ family protein [Arcicella sp.]|nr:HupE/UreJ family protein [Arcicella sp.]